MSSSTFAAAMKRWSESESETSESSEEELTQEQRSYVEIGNLFLQKAGLEWWFRSFDGPFTFASDCPLVVILVPCVCCALLCLGSASLRTWLLFRPSQGSGCDTPLMAVKMLLEAAGKEGSLQYLSWA